MSKKKKYTDSALLASLAEWDAARGPGRTLRHEQIRIKYGFPNANTACVYMTKARKLRDQTATPTPSPEPSSSPMTNGHGQDIMLDWLIAAERDLDLDRANTGARHSAQPKS